MQIKELLKMQRELDELIFEKAGIKEYPYTNMKLALLVELGELANEVQCFKHWKKNKNVNREKVLEEFADCLHFALSLENQLNQMEEEILDNPDCIVESHKRFKIPGDYSNNAFIIAYEWISENRSILTAVIALGICLDISLEDMEKSYLNKHEVNYKRQVEGY